MQTTAYHILILKLDEFIRKYYRNQLVRGAIYTSTLFLAFYLGVTLLEYIAEFGTTIRTTLFYLFIACNLWVIYQWIITPLLKLNKLSKNLSYEEAADIIGKHFTNVQDKLLNVLQLQNHQSSGQSDELIKASIDQKIIELKPIPFTSVINISENKKYLKYALIPFSIVIIILFAAPGILTESTKRLVKHNSYFEKKAPFEFVIENEDLNAIQQEDFYLKIKIKGDEVPEEAYIEFEGRNYKLDKENNISFNYTFKNIQNNIEFNFSANGYHSKKHLLNALPKPLLLDFAVQLYYPTYIHRTNETLKNTGDLLLPEGTKVKWLFNTRNTNKLTFTIHDSTFNLNPVSENSFEFNLPVLKNEVYSLRTTNQYFKNKDSINYSINVIPDLNPSIQVEQVKDSLSTKRFYFTGEINDDYGFSSLSFVYHFLKRADTASSEPITVNEKPISTPIPFSKQLLQSRFFHSWDAADVNVKPGDELEYYFEVWDNDGVHGPKAARSQVLLFKAPSRNELVKNNEKNNDELKEFMQQAIKEAKDLQKEMTDLSKRILEKKNPSWEEKKRMQDLLEKQKNLQQKVEQLKDKNEISKQQQNEYTTPDEKLVEKQKQLEELFNNVMNDEMKKMLAQMQEMMDKMDKDKMKEALDKMKLSNKDIEKELDRTLEVFKQLEVEQKLKNNIEKLQELAQKQEKLSDQSSDKKADPKQLEEKQIKLNDEFKEFQKDMKDLEKKNSELERPNDLGKTENKQENIKQEMQKSSEQLNQNNKKKASESQKNAAEEMKEMAQEMEKKQEEMEADNNSEDMQTLKTILDNLVHLSFDQEELINKLGKTRTDNPTYVKIAQDQKRLKDDAKMIEDSLLALSKRNPQIKSIVNREISAINMNMEKAIANLQERQSGDAASRQQFSMTSVNNLALLLNESMNQMMNQMRQKSDQAGKGSCKKPGGEGKKPSTANMRQMQEQMNKQLQKMKEAMEKGEKPGQKKSGGSMGTSAEFAKLAAQQEAIRREIQKMAEQLKKDGKKGGNEAGDLANKMEQTETELVNKMITQETIRRQQEIVTRLLESEKAEREREMEEKRESNEAKNEQKRNLFENLKYKALKEQETELLKTVPPTLNKYYKNKVTNYFNHYQGK